MELLRLTFFQDPQEYLPFLKELHAFDGAYQKFRIDDHLGRHGKALQSLYSAGKIFNCLWYGQYILNSFRWRILRRSDHIHWETSTLWRSFEDLAEKAASSCKSSGWLFSWFQLKAWLGRSECLGRLFFRSPRIQSSCTGIYRSTSTWKGFNRLWAFIGMATSIWDRRTAIKIWRRTRGDGLSDRRSLSSSGKCTRRISTHFTEDLSSKKRYNESARVLLDYTKDVKSAVSLFVQGNSFSEARRIVSSSILIWIAN